MGVGNVICKIGGKSVCPDIAPKSSQVVGQNPNTVTHKITPQQATELAKANGDTLDPSYYTNATIEEPAEKDFFNKNSFILRLQRPQMQRPFRTLNSTDVISFSNGHPKDKINITKEVQPQSPTTYQTTIVFPGHEPLFKYNGYEFFSDPGEQYIKRAGYPEFYDDSHKFNEPKYIHCENLSTGDCKEITPSEFNEVLLNKVPKFNNNGTLN